MKFPSIRQTAAQNPTIQDLIECVEILTGRRRNREIDYGTIDGVRTKALDIVHLCNMGRIKARAYRNAAQNIDAGTSTKILIDSISFDTGGAVDVLTNNRITPTLPGYYIVTGNVRVKSVPDGQRITAWIYKNGARISDGSYSEQGAIGIPLSVANDLIYMNGTTDYLELWAFNSHSSALALYVTSISTQNYLYVLGPF